MLDPLLRYVRRFSYNTKFSIVEEAAREVATEQDLTFKILEETDDRKVFSISRKSRIFREICMVGMIPKGDKNNHTRYFYVRNFGVFSRAKPSDDYANAVIAKVDSPKAETQETDTSEKPYNTPT